MTFVAQTLEDGHKLSDYHITGGSTLNLVLGIAGGMPKRVLG